MAINPLTGQLVPVQTGATFGAMQTIDPLTGAPPTGLLGAEQILGGTSDAALAALRQARNQSVQDLQFAGQQGVGELRQGRDVGTQFLGQAIGGFDPFAQQGTGAGNIQAALSGALGVQAQQAALANLQPVNAFLQEQGDRAVTRNASALGGLGGGNVLKELTRFGQGLAGQSAQQQFANLGTVAERGFGALTQQAGLRGQQAGIATQAGRDISSTLGRTAQDIAGTRAGAAANLANVFGGTGQQLATGRTRVGEQIAGAIGGTTSALANLAAQQGAGLSDITGGGASNLANILSGIAAQTGASQEQLAALLANITTGQAGQVAALPQIISQPTNTLGQMGQLAGGIGGILSALPPRTL